MPNDRNNANTNPFTSILNRVEKLRQDSAAYKTSREELKKEMEKAGGWDKLPEHVRLSANQKVLDFQQNQTRIVSKISEALQDALDNPSLLLDGKKIHPDFLKVLDFMNQMIYSKNFEFPQMHAVGFSSFLTLKRELIRARRMLIARLYDQNSKQVYSTEDMDNILYGVDEKLQDMKVIDAGEEINHIQDVMALMASSPDYNNMVYDKIKNVINRASTNPIDQPFKDCEEDLKRLGIKTDNASFMEIRGSLYQLFYVSAKFKEAQMSKDTGFKARVKGNELPDVFKEVKSKWGEYGESHTGDHAYNQDMKKIKDYITKLVNISKKNRVADMSPAQFAKGIRKYEIAHNLQPDQRDAEVEYGTPDISTDLFSNTDLDPAFFDELSHHTGNFRTSNSASYTAMGEALANIRKKQSNMDEVTQDDYKQLFERCVEYMMQHDSVPTSTSGKKRFQAAAVIAGTLAARLGINLAKENEYGSAYAQVGMIRSKDFRLAFTATIQKDFLVKYDFNKDIKENELNEATRIFDNINICENIDDALKGRQSTAQMVDNDENVTKAQFGAAVNKLLSSKPYNSIVRDSVLTEEDIDDFDLNQVARINRLKNEEIDKGHRPFPEPIGKVKTR